MKVILEIFCKYLSLPVFDVLIALSYFACNNRNYFFCSASKAFFVAKNVLL